MEDHARICKLEAELEHSRINLDSLKADHFESVYPDIHQTKELKQVRDCVAQTELIEWDLYVETRAQEERDLNQPQISNRTPATSRNGRSRIHTIPTNFDQNFSREEQGSYPNEPRYIQELEQRAQEYETEYRRLENEISDYKLQLQYAV